MKVYRISIGTNPKYAHIHSQIGQDLSKGIKVMWDDWLAKGNSIPDFVYSAYIICRETIAFDLNNKFKGLNISKLEWTINPKELCAKDKSRLKWLPKEKIELVNIFTEVDISILPQSTVKYGISGLTGKKCIKRIVGGSEIYKGSVIPREKDKGLFFDKKEVGDYDFFKPKNTFFLLCTETAKKYVEEKQYSNICFLEIGDVV